MIFEFLINAFASILGLVTKTLPEFALRTVGVGWIPFSAGHWVQLPTLVSCLSVVIAVSNAENAWRLANWIYDKIRG